MVKVRYRKERPQDGSTVSFRSWNFNVKDAPDSGHRLWES